MKLKTLIKEYFETLPLLVSTKAFIESIQDLPDDMSLTPSAGPLSEEPGGFIEGGKLHMIPPKPSTPSIVGTIADAKKNLERDRLFLTARLKTLRKNIIEELNKEEI